MRRRTDAQPQTLADTSAASRLNSDAAHVAQRTRASGGHLLDGRSDRYKWVALSNTTLGTMMATIDTSIMLIALPDIFRGIHLDPLAAGNSFYLLWMILSFQVVTAVLVLSFGRLGDIFGRVRMYNLGFALYTFFSLLLTITWMSGTAGATWLVVMRIFQGVGAAFLMANSAAILTDAFPEHQRGMALGINQVAGISGMFIGLVLGGILGPIDWRLIFLISVPIGLFGTVWAYLRLEERGLRRRARIDWAGNVTFALGLVAIMVGITYGIEPYGGHPMGWTSPVVLAELGAGIVLLVAFALIETKVAEPMFRLPLFRIRAFTAGVLSSFLAALGRGGLMFTLIIWLQGIWLPLRGYSFARTPLWAGIYMLPLTAGFLIAGPLSGILSDPWGANTRSCRAFVLVNEPTEKISALDVPHDADLCGRHSTFGSQKVKSSMRPLLVVVLHVAPQNPIQVPGTEDQRPVQTVGAQRLHPALGEGIRVGRPDRCADHANPFACEDVVEGARELGVAVADQDLGDRALVREAHGEVARLLSDEDRVRVAR